MKKRRAPLAECDQKKTKLEEQPVGESVHLEQMSISSHHDNLTEPENQKENLLTKVQQLQKKFIPGFIPENILGRSKEREQIVTWLTQRFENPPSLNNNNSKTFNSFGLCYVGGSPGTGKTLLINRILDEMSTQFDFNQISFNCFNLEQKSLLDVLFEKMKSNKWTGNKKTFQETLDHTTVKKKPLVLILDEIDQLRKNSQTNGLSTLLNLLKVPKHKLMIIGISNTLDLPTHLDFSLPNTIICHFSKYTNQQVEEIFAEKIGTFSELFEPSALKLLIAKAGTETDMRRANECVKKVLEYFEKEIEEHLLKSLQIENEEEKENGKPLKITASFVNQSLKSLLGSQSPLEDLPATHKYLIVSLWNATKFQKKKEIDYQTIINTYNSLCKKLNTTSSSVKSLAPVFDSLIDHNLIALKTTKRKNSLKLYVLIVSEKEMKTFLPKLLVDCMDG